MKEFRFDVATVAFCACLLTQVCAGYKEESLAVASENNCSRLACVSFATLTITSYGLTVNILPSRLLSVGLAPFLPFCGASHSAALRYISSFILLSIEPKVLVPYFLFNGRKPPF